MRIGELCGLWFCDLHLRKDHPCGERRSPHVHVVKRINPNGAAAKRAQPAAIVDGVVTGGIVRRVSPAMIDSYHEYLAEDYHRVRALAQTELVLVQLAGDRAGAGLSTHGARQMLARAGRRAGLGLVKPHAFRHTWVISPGFSLVRDVGYGDGRSRASRVSGTCRHRWLRSPRDRVDQRSVPG
jgi:integrase